MPKKSSLSSELDELVRKLNDPTSEEGKAMAAAEHKANDALMRAYEKDHHEETPAQPFECRVCGSTEYTPHPASNGRLGPGGRSWSLTISAAGVL